MTIAPRPDPSHGDGCDCRSRSQRDSPSRACCASGTDRARRGRASRTDEVGPRAAGTRKRSPLTDPASVLAKPTTARVLNPSPAYSATPATRSSRSVSWPMVSSPSSLSASISRSLATCKELGRRGPDLRGQGTNSTSRTHTETELRATPSSLAIAASVHDCPRSSLARSCSRALPPYPMASSRAAGCDRVRSDLDLLLDRPGCCAVEHLADRSFAVDRHGNSRPRLIAVHLPRSPGEPRPGDRCGPASRAPQWTAPRTCG